MKVGIEAQGWSWRERAGHAFMVGTNLPELNPRSVHRALSGAGNDPHSGPYGETCVYRAIHLRRWEMDWRWSGFLVGTA
jgi:hypothetical protein